MVIEDLLASAARRAGQPAARDPLRTLNYAELTTLARAMRRLVLAQTRCERVGIMLPSSAGGLATLLGVIWAGRTAVPLNFLLQAREIRAIIDDAGLDLVITTTHFREQMKELPIRAIFLEEAGLRWRYVRERLSRTPEPPAVSPHDVAVIVYTSGTTGMPKGVCLTHDNFDSNTRAAIQHLQIEQGSHLLGVIPPFHVFGLTVLHFLPVVLGGCAHYLPRFSPQGAYEAMLRPEISIFMAVPSMFAAIARLKHLDPQRVRHVGLTVSGGEPLPRAVYDAFGERLGLHLLEGYGMTETSPIISIDLPHAHRRGTVGPPIPGVEIDVRDAAGHSLPSGQEGELWVRGRLVMKGYYRKPEETGAVMDSNHWFRTGDLVRVDSERYITITGRAKDLIIVGGENVLPREVECVLESHPAVAECAVIGQADGTRGEVVVAFVTLHEGASATATELRAFCREHLGGYKVPRAIHLNTELPRGPTGKILKRELKIPTTPA